MIKRFLLGFVAGCLAMGQTTDGLISGRVIDSRSGQPIRGAVVEVQSEDRGLVRSSSSDGLGVFSLPLLSPGIYGVRVTAVQYQAQEIQQLELRVAARLELAFRLRPLSDIWESGQYGSVLLPGSAIVLNYFGPDLDSTHTGSFEFQNGRLAALESSVSQVIDGGIITALPLEGRDVYDLLVTQPGVTSDAATARSLGLSANGQRPTASSFLLDGLENNNYLITGPLTPVAPEAIQEYRLSTNNFSAEYGGTSGYLANAISKSGSNHFHGIGYFYLKNDVLDANTFQANRVGENRISDKEVQPGYVFGGPIIRNRLYFSSSFERLRSRSQQDPFDFLVPGATYKENLGPDSLIAQLLAKYPPPVTSGAQPLGHIVLAPPVSVDRSLLVERLDYQSRDGKNRALVRGIDALVNRPDFIWTPYPDFVTPLVEDSWAIGGSYIRTLSPASTNEFRASYSNDDLHFNRAHPETPTLVAMQFSPSEQIYLPGSPAFYSYKNASGTTELLDNVILSRGRHQVTFGGGVLLRGIDGYLTAGRDGAFFFGEAGVTSGFVALGEGTPSFAYLALDRLDLPTSIVPPPYKREYRYRQFHLFGEDSWKLTRRLTVNYGIRYEHFGAPSNVGPDKDALVHLGSGQTMAEKVADSSVYAPASGNEQLFGTDNKDLAFRSGAAWDLSGTGRTLLRGGAGLFYDRPFDNLWENVRNNDLVLPLVPLSGQINYLAPASALASTIPVSLLTGNFPSLTLIDPGFRNSRVYSYFAGVQHRIIDGLMLEMNALGSYGRDLITTDVINRDNSTPSGRLNPSLPDINYRANQGFSNYNAFTAVARYRQRRGMIQGSYTWSHSIDNQSDPLTGDFFDLSFTGLRNASTAIGHAAFTRQFDPNSDRGNSDFDQRHNLVLFSYWSLPSLPIDGKAGVLFRGWTIAGLAAFRSGFPFTVVQGSVTDPLSGEVLNPRPDIVNANVFLTRPVAVAGGEQLLNPAAFSEVTGRVGNEGRNALRGPGFYNIDLSLGRAFALPHMGESARLTLRADAFNVLNHANLNNPDPFLTSNPDFGVASFGRLGRSTGFPVVSPLNETPRQIQLLLRLEF